MTFHHTSETSPPQSHSPASQNFTLLSPTYPGTGCLNIRFSEWDYLPWNNSENMVDHQLVTAMGRMKSTVQQVLFVFGAPANIINMVVFFKQNLKDRVNLLLFSLSLADELSLITATLHCFEEFYSQFTPNPAMGPVFLFIMNNYIIGFQAFCFVSFLLSAFIACDRCYCVLRPLKYQTLIRTKTVAFIIVGIYVLVLGPFFLVVSRYYIQCFYDMDTGTVKYLFHHTEFYTRNKDLVDLVDSIMFGAGLQSGMLIVVVTATVVTVYRLRKVVAWRTETTSVVSAKEIALTKMLIGTSILLIVCVSPSGLLRIAGLFLPEMNTGGRLQNFYLTCIRISLTFVYINSSFNFFVYYIMGARYRETFWGLLRRKSGQRKLQK